MVEFGVSLWQEEFGFEGLKGACREVEDMGYDSVWIYDHFYPMSLKTSRYILEAWTLLPSLAAETSRVRLGVLVTCNSYRYPSVLAKIAATVDVMTEGRLEFGIGAGWYEDEHEAYGVPFPAAKTRIEQLAESVELIKRVWTREKANFKGKYYTIKDLVSHPKPLQKPHPPVWIGGKGDNLLRIVARHADYANLFGCSFEDYRQRLDVLKKHCNDIGRDYEEIDKTWHGLVIIADAEEDIRRKALAHKASNISEQTREMSFKEFLNLTIAGNSEQCIEKIQRFVDLGVTYFIPHFPFDQDLEAAKKFAKEVAPAFK